MSIQLECDFCGRVIKAKDEYAGRKMRCPGCREVITVPRGDDDFTDEYDDEAPVRKRPSASASKRRGKRPAERKGSSAGKQRSWFRRNWHWATAGAVLLLAFWPKVGLVLAGLVAGVGVLMVLIGGIAPFLRILFGDPGTILTMLLSRSARFEMMRQPDDHPYKVLVRTAFDPTRGLFWKGVLLMVMFMPAMVINQGVVPELFKNRGQTAAPAGANNPNLHRAGPVRPNQPRVPNRNPRPAGRGNPVGGGNVAGDNNPVGGGNEAGGGFAPQGFRAQRQQAARPAAGADRVFYVTVTYGSFQGQGSMEDVVQPVVQGLPGYVEDSLNIDEAAKAVRFQHRGRIPPPDGGKLFKRLKQDGFASPRLRLSTRAPG